MKFRNQSKPTEKYRKPFLCYLALSAATSTFWTWVIHHLISVLSLWGCIGIFLVLFFFTFSILACFAAGASSDLPALRED